MALAVLKNENYMNTFRKEIVWDAIRAGLG